MPFIEDKELAALYKEVDQERQAAVFFQNLHQKNKKSLTRLFIYKWGSLLLLIISLVLGVLFSISSSKSEVDSLKVKIKQLQVEQQLVNDSFTGVQNHLQDIRVYTVQIAASRKDKLLLFSEHFVNFRAHPMQGFNAYSLGNFATEEEANAFKDSLKEIGLDDVWVTSYLNGKRILLEDE